MAVETKNVIIHNVIKSAIEWGACEDIIPLGQVVYCEVVKGDTKEYIVKIGDGVHTYNDLPKLFKDNTELAGDLATKVDKSNGISQIYGTDDKGYQTMYSVASLGLIDDVKVNGSTIVNNRIANLALGTMATENKDNYINSSSIYEKLNDYARRDDLSDYMRTEDIESRFVSNDTMEQILDTVVSNEKLDETLGGYVSNETANNFITKNEFNTTIEKYATNEQLEGYVTKSELESDFATKEDLNSYVAKNELPEITSQFVKMEQVPEIVSDFVKKSELSSTMDDIIVEKEIITENNINNTIEKHNLITQEKASEIIDGKMGDYAKSEALNDYALKSVLENEYVLKTSLSDYVKMVYLESLYTTTADLVANYVNREEMAQFATKDDLDGFVSISVLNEYLSLDNFNSEIAKYVTKEDMGSSYVSKVDYDSKIQQIDETYAKMEDTVDIHDYNDFVAEITNAYQTADSTLDGKITSLQSNLTNNYMTSTTTQTKIDAKQDKLTAGNCITITNNTIAVSDSTYAKNNSDNTFSGANTFSKSIIVSTAASSGSDAIRNIEFWGANKYQGSLTSKITDTGSHQLGIYRCDNGDSAQSSGIILEKQSNQNTAYLYNITIAENDNSNKIATTAWVQQRIHIENTNSAAKTYSSSHANVLVISMEDAE